MENVKETKHKWLKSHPVVYALIVSVVSIGLLLVVGSLAQLITALSIMIFRGSLGERSQSLVRISSGIGFLAYVLMLLLYWVIFRKKLQGFFHTRKLGMGILLCWSVLAINAVGFIMGMVEHMTYGNIATALLLGVQPGVTEEIVFRVIPISFAMKSREREKLVMPIVVFTSVIFGLFHGINIFAGAAPLTTLCQVLYAAAIGFLFAAIYIRTGNMWITMFLHSLTDVISCLGVDMQNSNGILTQEVGLVSVMVLFGYAALYFVNAFLVFRKNNRTEIPKTWEGIWKIQD